MYRKKKRLFLIYEANTVSAKFDLIDDENCIPCPH